MTRIASKRDKKISKCLDAEDRILHWELRTEVGEGSNRKQVRRRFATEAAALEALGRIGSDKIRGEHVVPDKTMTVRRLAERWTVAKKATLKPSTERFYADALRVLLDRHGDLPVAKLTSEHMVALRDDMLRGDLRSVGRPGAPLSARSANAMLTVATNLLEFGKRRSVVARNVADPALAPRVKDNRTDDEKRSGWQNHDLSKFKVAVAEDRLCGSWALTAIGMRRGEVVGLRWSDVDLESGLIKIRTTRVRVYNQVLTGTPKSKASRRDLTVGADVVDALVRQRARQEIEAAAGATNAEGWVTVDEAGGPVRPEVYSDLFTQICAEAGLPPIVLHGVRHAAASRMASKGVPLAAIAQWLGQGQASLATTLGYVRAQDSDGARIRAALAD